MKELTFITFAANDDPDEQLRLSLWIDSWLCQSDKRSKILFMDCSLPGKEFKIPQHEDITVIKNPIEKWEDWNRSVLRNNLALQADTRLICQTCSDCFYSPNFVETLINTTVDEITLVGCRRRKMSHKHWDILKRYPKRVESLQANAFKIPYQADGWGECQCINRQFFIDIGGYYQLIKQGHSTIGQWNITAARDDVYLYNLANKSPNMKYVSIEDYKDVYLIHIWHQWRLNAWKWDNRNRDPSQIHSVPGYRDPTNNHYKWSL